MPSPLCRAVACLALVAAAAGAATYYVAPPAAGGSDGNPGTLALPWATLQHAADLVAAGDTVVVRGGDFAGFYLDTSGAPGAPITFRAFPGEMVTITSDNGVTPDGINLEGADWIVVEGFRLVGRTRAGIRAVLCHHVTIRANVAEANGRWGIFTGCCEDLLIEGNATAHSVLEHGIYVSNSGDRPVVRGNVSWENRYSGLHMNGDLSVECDGAVATDGVISDAVVENNVLFGNGNGGSAINCDGVQDSLIRNNLVFATHASGISLYRIDGGEPSHGNRVEGNTVLVAADGRWALNIRDGSAGTLVRNNLFWSDHPSRGALNVCSPACLTGLASDYNGVEDRFTLDDGGTVLTLAGWRQATGLDLHSLVATPAQLFVAPTGDPLTADYRLRPGSPGLDSGTPIADLLVDLAGTPRPIGPGWDLGALEGADLLFADGFERLALGRWSAVAP